MKVNNKGSRWLLWMTVFLGMLAAIAPLSTDMYLPALPSMMKAFAVSPSGIQLTLTFSMAGMAVGQVAVGPISDDQGRRRPLMVGMAIFTLATVGCILSPSIGIFLLFRLIQGCAGGAGIVLSRAIARDICKGSALTRLFAMLMLVNGIAPILAPVIGGQILRFAPWEGIFVLVAVIGLILTVSAALMRETLPQRRRASGGLTASLKGMKALFHQPYFMGHCIMQCFGFAAFFSYISGSSFVFQNVYGVSAQAFSYIFGLNGIGLMINGAMTGRMTGRIADWKLLRGSLLVAAVGSVLLLGAFWFTLPLPLVIIILFLTISTLSMMSTSSFSMAMQDQGRSAGSASALIGFFSMISGAVMAPVVGIAGDHTAIPMGIVMVIGEIGALVTFYLLIYPRHRNDR
ncbi:multidrug effflux MFS transporter [Megasphaera sp.]|uniref:multidrug effflux MFS transporter n=1 Tax=Megasphaera sp. TaxID=2023260 RepID=UPI00351FB52E